MSRCGDCGHEGEDHNDPKYGGDCLACGDCQGWAEAPTYCDRGPCAMFLGHEGKCER